MSTPPTLQDSRNAISSLASADGHTRFVLPAGQMTDLFGPVPARANLSARQARELGLMTSGTFGPPSTTSSASAALQLFLESRLQARTQSLGSTLYKLTWKRWLTPSGVSRSRLRGSVPRTSATEFTGWPTPTGPAPHDSDATAGRARPRPGYGVDLPIAAALCGWATPVAVEPDQQPETVIARKKRHSASTGVQRGPALPLGTMVHLSGWPTCTSQDAARGAKEARPWDTGKPLNQIAALAGPIRFTASGQLLTGSSAGMESGGQLNPEHSRWLMGYPPAWCVCAVTAMQSIPTKRRRS